MGRLGNGDVTNSLEYHRRTHRLEEACVFRPSGYGMEFKEYWSSSSLR